MQYKTELGVLCKSLLDMLESQEPLCTGTTLFEYQHRFAQLVAGNPHNTDVDISNENSLPIFVYFKRVESEGDVTAGGVTKFYDQMNSEYFIVNIDDIAFARISVRSPYSPSRRSIPLGEPIPGGVRVNVEGIKIVKSLLRQWGDWSELHSNLGEDSDMNPPESSPLKETPVVSTNDSRNKWLREQKAEGKLTIKEIRVKLKNEHPDWNPLESDASVNRAIQTYEKRHKLNPIAKRKRPNNND